MASRGARVLTVLVVTAFTALLAATVLLWQRVEATQRPTTPPAPVTAPAPTMLEYELAVLRGYVAEFQRAIDNGSIRSGRFVYCG